MDWILTELDYLLSDQSDLDVSCITFLSCLSDLKGPSDYFPYSLLGKVQLHSLIIFKGIVFKSLTADYFDLKITM